MGYVTQKTCSKCARTLPRALFKRQATLLQTRALLKNPLATRRMTIESRYCNDCAKPSRQPFSDAPIEATRKRMISEREMPLWWIESRIAQRKAISHDKHVAAGMKGARTRWAKDYDALFARLARVRSDLGRWDRYDASRALGLRNPDAERFVRGSAAAMRYARDLLRARLAQGRSAPASWLDVLDEPLVDRWRLELAKLRPVNVHRLWAKRMAKVWGKT